MVDQQSVPYGQFRRIGGPGITAAILIGIVVFADAWWTATSWNSYQVIRDYLAGDATGNDLVSADDTMSNVSIALVVAILLAAVAFIVWLWQARTNTEVLYGAMHRRARGWVIGGWICPVVNLWFPYMIVEDVYDASRPDEDRGNRLIGVWWALWLGAALLNRIVAAIWNAADTLDGLRTAAVLGIVESAVTAGAAVTIMLIMRRIIVWQHAPRPAVTG